MARGKTSQAKAAEALRKLAADQGMSIDLSGFAKMAENASIADNSADGKRGHPEPESVMRILHKPHDFITKKCAHCGDYFSTNFCGTKFCSDQCCADELAKIGIAYDPYQKRRWESSMFASNSGLLYRYEPPDFITHETVLMLEEFARSFLADLDRLKVIAEEVESQQRQKNLQESQRALDELLAEPVVQFHEETEPHLESLDTIFGTLNDDFQANFDL